MYAMHCDRRSWAEGGRIFSTAAASTATTVLLLLEAGAGDDRWCVSPQAVGVGNKVA